MESRFYQRRVNLKTTGKPFGFRIVLPAGIIAGAAGIIVSAFIFIAPYSIKKAAPDAERDSLSSVEATHIRPGDLILIAGLRHSADLIINALAEDRPFSHIGIVVDRPDGLHVVHSVHGALTGIDGVQENTLREFAAFARPASILVMRPLWTGDSQAAAACRLAGQKLMEHIPFDDRYDWNDDSTLYCGEFIAKVLNGTGFWNASKNGKFKAGVLIFASFLQKTFFMPIINHAQVYQTE